MNEYILLVLLFYSCIQFQSSSGQFQSFPDIPRRNEEVSVSHLSEETFATLFLLTELSNGSFSHNCILELAPLFADVFPSILIYFPRGRSGLRSLPTLENSSTAASINQLEPYVRKKQRLSRIAPVLRSCERFGDKRDAVLLFLFHLLSSTPLQIQSVPSSPPVSDPPFGFPPPASSPPPFESECRNYDLFENSFLQFQVPNFQQNIDRK